MTKYEDFRRASDEFIRSKMLFEQGKKNPENVPDRALLFSEDKVSQALNFLNDMLFVHRCFGTSGGPSQLMDRKSSMETTTILIHVISVEHGLSRPETIAFALAVALASSKQKKSLFF